ncbi:MAG: ABC transporter permease [Clostridia bacterium]|nr:ABC transporter permease [Clostridia bacterium]
MKILSRSYIAIVFAILYIPILVLMLFSFNSTASTGVFSGFSFQWYGELFKDARVFTALRNTLILAVSSSLISTVIATGAAVGLDRMRSAKIRGVINSVTNIPMMNPDIVTGVSMMLLFAFFGNLVGATADKLNFFTLLIAHITFNIPYVLLNITPRLRQMDRNLPEAARDLGCTPVQSFFKVELPFMMPSIIAGAIMAFTLSLDDFVISYFTSGSDFETLPILIYSLTKKEVKPNIYALSTLIIIAIISLLILSNVMSSRSNQSNAGSLRKGKDKLNGKENI